MSDFNEKIIKEFRENNGVVGGYFEGRTILLLHTIGAKSGNARLNPVVTLTNADGKHVIVASAAGADSHPAWYHNLVATPDVTVEVGTEKYDAVARVTEEPERTTLYEMMEAEMSGFTEYKNKTSRVIPVVVLERK